MLRNKGSLLLGLLMFVAFSIGIIHLVLLRFSSGDVYPYYSSLRSDPIGTKALYESLQQYGLNVSRNYEPFERVKDRVDTAFFFPGADVPWGDLLPIVFVEDLEFYLRNGGRIVVNYVVQAGEGTEFYRVQKEQNRRKEEKRKQEGKEGQKDKDEEELLKNNVYFSRRWGISYKEYPLSGAQEAELKDQRLRNELPQKLSWHSTLYFDDLSPEWEVIYERAGKPVLIQRKMGKGEVILAADSYFLSNEGLMRERHPDLIAWLIGDKRNIIFDEYFHGVASNPGVAALARRYHLEGVFLGLLALTALFFWKNSQSFVPPLEEERRDSAPAMGKDSASGLINLLRRSVSAKEILAVCYAEWKKTMAHPGAGVANKVKRMDSIYRSNEPASHKPQDSVRLYNEMSREWKQR